MPEGFVFQVKTRPIILIIIISKLRTSNVKVEFGALYAN